MENRAPKEVAYREGLCGFSGEFWRAEMKLFQTDVDDGPK